jgi:hypothetical protein
MIDEIRREARRILSRLQFFAIGKVKKIDYKNYMVQVEILTTGMITNWLRIGERYVGDGFGEAKSPNIDDEVLICFPDGDPSGQGVVVCRLYGKDLPPKITEDEIVCKHKSGTILIIRKNGDVEIKGLLHEIFIRDDKIFIGKDGAKDPLVLGNKLLSYLSKVRVICTNPGQLSSTLRPSPSKDLLSDHYFTTK